MQPQTPIPLEEVDAEEVTNLIVFHDTLNPKFWDTNGKMKVDIRFHLLQAAMSFYEFIEMPGLKIEDVTVCGSNAAYNYTDLSDLDVHLIVDFEAASCSSIIENFFITKKTLWNTLHDITISGQPVEMYVQDKASSLQSNGVYSILKSRWVSLPRASKPQWDDQAVVAKTEACADEIEAMLIGDAHAQDIDNLLYRIHNMRRSGLAKGGEFSTENLAYKSLRNLGYLDKLHSLKNRLHDQKLSKF